jgi:hypothetical protein
MALSTIQKVRLEVGDTDITLPILDDEEYKYFLSKNGNSIRRAAVDAAKSIMFKLSMRTDETVDLFSIKGSKAAQNYMLALQAFLKSPDMNPIMQAAMPYAGGISVSDMETNDANPDNNTVKNPAQSPSTFPDSYFEV